METLILCLCLMVVACCLTALVALVCLFIYRSDLLPRKQEVPKESEQELDTKKKRQEMQAKYEQGFINLMNYDGSPVRKERDGL